MRKLILAALAAFSTAAFAKIELRIPILLHTSIGNDIYNIADVKDQWESKGLSFPDYLMIQTNEETEQLGEIDRQIEEAELAVDGDNTLYMERYGRPSDFMGPNVTFPMCYKKVGRVSTAKAAREAYAFVSQLHDRVFSEQYTISGYRFYGDKNFTNWEGKSGEESAWMDKKYGSTVLKPGDVQIVAATNDDGDNDSDDILSLCE